jgi:class III poly(R)-hydroxyalkanoic acid synthase PhaE subunit
MFSAWTNIYEKEFQKYFNIPALGLNRLYIERVNRAQDSYNIFQVRLSEFLFVLYLPFEKSFKVIQQELAEKSKTGELPESHGDYYGSWIKILEGHYMKLFQSVEYAAVLNRTIDALSEFKASSELVMGDILQMFAIPTRQELDELYKDLYMTKKELRAIKKRLKDIEKKS